MSETLFKTTRPPGVETKKTCLPSCSEKRAKTLGPSTTLGIPRARASSWTCETTLPSPWVKMPAAGWRSAGVSSSATTSSRE